MLITLLGSSVSRFLLYKKDFENQTFILPKLLKYSDQILTDYQILKKSLSPLICLTFFSQGKTFSSNKVNILLLLIVEFLLTAKKCKKKKKNGFFICL